MLAAAADLGAGRSAAVGRRREGEAGHGAVLSAAPLLCCVLSLPLAVLDVMRERIYLLGVMAVDCVSGGTEGRRRLDGLGSMSALCDALLASAGKQPSPSCHHCTAAAAATSGACCISAAHRQAHWEVASAL